MKIKRIFCMALGAIGGHASPARRQEFLFSLFFPIFRPNEPAAAKKRIYRISFLWMKRAENLRFLQKCAIIVLDKVFPLPCIGIYGEGESFVFARFAAWFGRQPGKMPVALLKKRARKKS